MPSRSNQPVRTLLVQATVCCLLLFCLVPHAGAAAYTLDTIPNVQLQNAANYVSNPDGILDSASVASINTRIADLRRRTGVEIAVVAVEALADDAEPRTFATDLFEKWGIGRKDKDDGLLILLVTDPSQRIVIFETGYGLEGILPDAISSRIQRQYMVPDMKNGDYSTGMRKGVEAVGKLLLQAYTQENTGSSEEWRASSSPRASAGSTGNGSAYDVENLFPFLFLLYIVIRLYIRRKRTTCPKCGTPGMKRIERKTVRRATSSSSGLVVEVYRCNACGFTDRREYRTQKSSSGRIGGGFGGGSGGGSSRGGSFGGGRSGGGGAGTRF